MWLAALFLIGQVDCLPDCLPDCIPIAKPAPEPFTPIIRDPLNILRYEQRCVNGVCELVPVFAPEVKQEAKVTTEEPSEPVRWRLFRRFR